MGHELLLIWQLEMTMPSSTSRRAPLAAAALLAAMPFALLHAQTAPPPADPAPGERGVARISIVNGEVSVRRGDAGEWVAAAVNAPLMVEDRVATGAGARAEVQFDSANMLRIGANAEVRLAQLDRSHYHVQVAHGTTMFRVLRESHAHVEIDTPAVSVRPLDVGAYRVYVQGDGQTEITVRLGTAQIYTPRGSEQLQAGQTMLVRGQPSDPEFRVEPAIDQDEWDRWNEQRDQELLNSRSYNNVPPDIDGSEDLDGNGRWVDVPSYGEVWSPAVGPDWAPYTNGRWVWEDYYGWTWISYDPWGWAPFHYGRWLYAAPYGWCWYPGRFGPHYWSPALVAFFGFGPGVGVGFGFGNVGWVPLAPFEVMHPWWGSGFYAGYRNPAYFNRGVGVTSVNIASVYRNARIARAVSTVSATDFRQGHFSQISHATPGQIREAGLVRGPLPVAPSAANLRYSNRTVANVPRSTENVRFFTHSTPAPVERVPFSEQQRSMQTFSRQASVMPRATGPAGTENRRATAAAPNAGGWRRVDEPTPAANRAGDAPERSNGWQRFGEPRPTATGWNVARPSNSGYGTNSQPARSPQSIRVAPQVVRERPASGEGRSAPRSSEGGGGHASHSGGGGGGSHGGGGHR